MLVYLRVILNGQFIYNCELYHHHHQSDFFIKKVKHKKKTKLEGRNTGFLVFVYVKPTEGNSTCNFQAKFYFGL